METEPILRVRDLSISFHTPSGVLPAVRSVSFDVGPGEIIAVVGESGSGKSVMTQSLLHLVASPPASYDGGAVYFEGYDIFRFKQRQLMGIKGAQISYVFQDPMTSLNPTMRVGKQIVECYRRHNRVSIAQADNVAIDLLREMGIPNPEKRFYQYPHEMSGGMRQRAIIAIAIACKPRILIADEPTTALDATIQSQILEILKDLKTHYGMSILLITHNLGIVAGMAQRVFVMYAGRIIESATVADLFRRPLHPYTQALLKAVPRLDDDSDKPLGFIVGSPPNMLSLPRGCSFAPRCRYCMRVCQQFYPQTTDVDGHGVACWLMDRRGVAIRGQVDGQVMAGG